jgi:hypothetical protein
MALSEVIKQLLLFAYVLASGDGHMAFKNLDDWIVLRLSPLDSSGKHHLV